MKRFLIIFAALCCLTGINAQSDDTPSINIVLSETTPETDINRVQGILGEPADKSFSDKTETDTYRLLDENGQKQKFYFVYNNQVLKKIIRHDKDTDSDETIWNAEKGALGTY